MQTTDNGHQLPSDEQLEQLIISELLQDERVSASNIEVAVKNGGATLGGTVTSYRRKLAAQKIVAAFDGISEVRNNLVVEPSVPAPDPEIAEDVRSSLNASADLIKETVAVEVTGGKVTLTGTVASIYEKICAEDLARGVRGVCDVVNMLVVNQDHRIDDHELMNSVQAVLNRVGGLRHCDVNVAIAEDTVVLSGTVKNAWQREAAETAVGRFRFVNVRNEIRVANSSSEWLP